MNRISRGFALAESARPWRAPVLLPLACAAVILSASGCGSQSHAGPPATTASPSTITRAAAGSVAERSRAVTSLVAAARTSRVVVHRAPAGAQVSVLTNPTATGAPLIFRVLGRQKGWIQVSLPVRPNGASGWVSETDVTLSVTPFRVIVSRSAHLLDVEYQGRRVARYPVGIGKAATPTPSGTYYLTELIKSSDPAGIYGPYAFGLSAFSPTLTSFAAGPGQIGLHGTDSPTGLGHDVSHGCLRVANTVITQLAHELPLGTPVEIRG